MRLFCINLSLFSCVKVQLRLLSPFVAFSISWVALFVSSAERGLSPSFAPRGAAKRMNPMASCIRVFSFIILFLYNKYDTGHYKEESYPSVKRNGLVKN